MSNLNPGLIFFITALGLAFGSFCSVLIERMPQKLTIGGRSCCPECKHQLSWPQLIPIFSWLLLRGKCKFCGLKISWQYPLFELACCVGLWLAYFASDDIFTFLATSIFIIFGLTLSAIDIKTYTLPNPLVYLEFLLILILVISNGIYVGDFSIILLGLEGALISSAFYFAMHLITGGMGMGDVKLAASIGLLASFYKIPWLLTSTYLAFLIGAFFSIYLILFKNGGRKTRVPFGPFMILGSLLGFFLSNQINNWISALFN